MDTKTVAGVEVLFTPGYSQWDMAGDTWHINWQLGEKKKGKEVFHVALLHKLGSERTSPFPGRTYPTGSVTGMPRAV
ncbi:hypothetical protein [Tateyamaria sp.]|uniref:hypothetical protein n=1 Tax=Tateyamaria sp. TaxID=1929288 RepID=UPI003B20F902